MRCSDFFKYLVYTFVAFAGGCMSPVDPGLDKRYNVAFAQSSSIAGKIFHWGSMPVKLKYYACAVSGCSSAGEAAVKRGIEFWQKNATLSGEVQTTYAEPADVEVKYVASLSGNVIGVCSGSLAQSSQSRQYYMVTPITLTIATTVQGQAISASDTEFVAAHEMGHCLGLWDHSPREGDLMNAYLTSGTKYSARDVNSLRYLYSQNSDVGVVPASALSIDLDVTGEIAVSPPLLLP